LAGPAPGERARAGEQARVRLRDVAVPLGILLALGLALRLIIAYVLLPGSGFGVDRNSFNGWAVELARNGAWGLYDRPIFIDYTPGYLYVLWALGAAAGLVGGPGTGPGDWMKLPAILADAGLALAACALVIEAGGSRRASLLAAALVTFVPVTWFDSAVWAQVDSVGTLVLLLAVRELWRGHDGRATVLTTAAAIIKPQFGILIPLAAVWILHREWRRRRDASADGGGYPSVNARRVDGWWLDDPLLWAGRLVGAGAIGALAWTPAPGAVELLGLTAVALAALLAVFARDRHLGRGPGRLVSIGLVGVVTAQLVCLPFGITIGRLARQIVETASGYPWATVNAYNPWALATQDGNGLAAAGTWIRDVADPLFPDQLPLTVLGLPALLVGTLLIIGAILLFAAAIWRRDDRRSLLITLTVMAIAFFVLPTRVHERYLYPFFALGAVVVALSPRWSVVYGALAVANTANLYGVLTEPFYQNPGLRPMVEAFGGFGARLGEAIRSWTGVASAAVLHAGGLLVGAAFLVRPTRGETDATAALIADDPGDSPAGAEAIGAPAPGGLRAAGALGRAAGSARALVGRASFDRSRLLDREGGGRLDRLDLWFIVVLVVASLFLRTFRLGEPARMHFDEVYHARTAAEFLQDWRYGQPHAIYEYTHPHLAKYAIAGGLVAFGDDTVTATSRLGAPVADVAIEPRWDEPTGPDGAALQGGDRLYVATGADVRVFDLLTRERLATFVLPGAQAVALDATGHRLYIGTASGDVLALDTAISAGDLRAGDAGAPTPVTLDPVAAAGGAVGRLWVTDSGATLIAATPGDTLVSLDTRSGTRLASVRLPGRAEVVDAGTVDALVADPATVDDPAGVAAQLARILGGTAATYEKLLRSGATRVAITTNIKDQRTQLDAAIASRTLAGLSVTSVPRVAVADAAGVAFVEPLSGAVTGRVSLDDGATGLVKVDGLDAPMLYAATGHALAAIRLPADGTAPSVDQTVWMPAAISRVTVDAASQIVHALGRTPDGTGWTVYAVEPRGNSVFADARLPFEPATWAADVNVDLPATDRQQLLVFAADGEAASVAIGQHAFAWRLPGVIAGALMAGLLFLLARILFRRRSVAILAGVFGLLDGMFFVQQRIAMNDSYAALFMVAAVTLFAAIWTGAWRWRGAFWVGMPVVGVLLGLGLASKWVALYAIGAIGLLILVRSALGRVVVVLGLVAVTAVLGYIAASVPAGATAGGNLAFLAIMIGLTLVAAAVTVLHPIAWSVEEVRVAVAGPAAAGALIALAAIPLQLGSTALALALGCFGLAALAAGAFWFAGRLGFGPLAPPPAADDPASLLEPPAPPPDGWLRPGWRWGIPIGWAGVSLLAIPAAVYVALYLPWVALGNRLTESFPAGNKGQTLLDLTKSMYDYHNNLRATHAAASPWWGWPLNLKPVWFFQQGFGGSTSGAIYDGGNLAIWWLSIPAIAFVAWQAYRRRSLALGLISILIACTWISWARIDRATFEYHYYTTLPFVVLGLAYFVAELWHGPSARTWRLARGGAAAALLAPVVMWLGKGPLCAIAGVEKVNAGSQACSAAASLPFSLTAQVVGLIGVLVVGGGLLVWQLVRLDRSIRAGADRLEAGAASRRILVTGLLAGASLVAAALLLPPTPLVRTPSIPGELLALLLLLILGPIAWLAWSARSPRRFAVGVVLAAATVFVAFYPNWSGLPLPNGVFNWYQGLLPSWLYPFQFAVNTDPAFSVSFASPWPLLLLAAVLVSAVIVAYSAWVWRIAIAEQLADEAELAEPTAP
jgi:4-amino-4-deoxy-L-arabinose transferase-like glycosyltransferase